MRPAGVFRAGRDPTDASRVRMSVLLVDMDAFFASVEQAHHAPLRGKPVIVCGDPGRRGVVTAASYEARPFGVHAGMPVQEARRLCPHAEFVEGDPEKYVNQSLALMNLYLTFTPDVEPFSVDEAFVGFLNRGLDEAASAARGIQQAIAERFSLGASIGVGPNKLIAKMAAGLDKPKGLTVLDEASFRERFWPLDIQQMWGVGPRLAERMRSLGFKTVGDLAHAPDPVLKGAFGIIGPQLREAAWGHDDTPLTPYHEGTDVKSMGHEVTLADDSDDPAYLEGTLLRLSDQVARRLRGDGYAGRTVVLKLRNHRFVTFTRQKALSEPTADHERIYRAALGLLRAHWKGGAVRLIGVSVTSLEQRAGEIQTELFKGHDRRQRLTEAADRVRNRLGEASLVPLGSLIHRRGMRHVPFGAMSGQTLLRSKSKEGGGDP